MTDTQISNLTSHKEEGFLLRFLMLLALVFFEKLLVRTVKKDLIIYLLNHPF
jgi:hypothetical protein